MPPTLRGYYVYERGAEWCNHHNRDVTLDECVRCRLLCAHRPGLHESGLQSAAMVERWGRAEIERFREGLRGAVE